MTIVSLLSAKQAFESVGLFSKNENHLDTWHPKTHQDTFSGVGFETNVKPGDLYIDLYGEKDRSKTALNHAFQMGAVAACSIHSHDIKKPLLQIVDPNRALSLSSALLYDHPSSKLRVIGITGTSGKSTMVGMLARCFQFAKVPNGFISSVGSKTGRHFVNPTLTTPDAPDIHKYLYQMTTEGVKTAIVESSSHGLAFKRVADVQFNAALINNISLDHNDFHPDFDHYIRTKQLLFEMLPDDGYAVFYMDDPGASKVAHATQAIKIGVGYSDASDVQIQKNKLILKEKVTEHGITPSVEIAFQLSVPGKYNQVNAALVATTAHLEGLSPETIQSALSSFPGLPRRFQKFQLGEITVIDTTPANPASMESSFNAVIENNWHSEGIVVLVSVRGNRGELINRQYGESVSECIKKVGAKNLIIALCQETNGPNDIVTKAEQTAFFDGLQSCPVKAELFSSMESALLRGLELVNPGETLLLIGSVVFDAAFKELQRLYFLQYLERQVRVKPSDFAYAAPWDYLITSQS